MLESGADPKKTLAQLKEAAAAAQQEARFAVLALSSAGGSAPFDSALRRYVDFLTADGQLEVDLEIADGVRLAPDEQIEVFRIVQEGLANARKHAGARHAEVRIEERRRALRDRCRRRLGLRRAADRRGPGPEEHAGTGGLDRRRLSARLGSWKRNLARSRPARLMRIRLSTHIPELKFTKKCDS
jgi:hypothetical protein